MRCPVKEYGNIFFYILDILIFNAFVICFPMVKQKKTYTGFWAAVAKQLLETVKLLAYSISGCPSS
jgi:hypothetical protein